MNDTRPLGSLRVVHDTGAGAMYRVGKWQCFIFEWGISGAMQIVALSYYNCSYSVL